MNMSKGLQSCKRVLFCTDFSENADRIFQYALDVVQQNGAEATLYLLHIIPEPPAQFWKGYIYEVDDDVDARARAEIDEKMKMAYFSRIPDTLRTQCDIRIGEAAHQILDYAHKNDIDLIVIGREGEARTEKILFGNVAERVVRKSKCPVMVIPLTYINKSKPE